MLWSIIRRLTGVGKAAASTDDALGTGIKCIDRGEFAEARVHLQRALAASPDDTNAIYFLAFVEARSGQLEQAKERLEALRVIRDDADVNCALGNVHRMGGRLTEAAADYVRALEIDGKHLAALANLGLSLRDQGAPRQALPVIERALALAPDDVQALFNKALVLIDIGEGQAANDLIERVLKLDPDFAEAHVQRGFMLLKRGDFAAGWREYAWRVRIPEVDHWQDYAYPLWQGEPLSGKRLLVQAEQGLGDQIMFASCLPDLLASAQHVMVECDPRLAKLFSRSFPRAAIYRHRAAGEPDWSREPAPDYRARCGDLPRMLRNRESDFPGHAGYLVPDPGRVVAWRERLAALGPGLKIGVSWRGGTPSTGQARRSIALDAWRPILSTSGTHFVSLQYGDVSAEISELKTRHGIVVHSWANSAAGMDDVAALVASLDLVITVCTTAAHLAGSLGKTTWVVVPVVAEWRYLHKGTTIPWYPRLRLFRQQQIDEWDDVLATVTAELAREVASRCE